MSGKAVPVIEAWTMSCYKVTKYPTTRLVQSESSYLLDPPLDSVESLKVI